MTREILTVAEMYEADRRTMAHHVPGAELMEQAGRHCAAAVMARWPRGKVAVLCGPGNNGGDGFVIARHLAQAGWDVRVGLLGAADRMKGDAALMVRRWRDEVGGGIEPLSADFAAGASLVVDAVFGAGLSRPVGGEVAAVFEAVRRAGQAVLAVDIPSGVDGDSGKILGTALPAALTVTFARRKIGHALLPGRLLCGDVHVVDIGIPDAVIRDVAAETYENEPSLWQAVFPRLAPEGHKYHRGHALVVSGGASSTGAARLAARGALRIGAGLVTVASPPEALLVNAMQLTAIMVRSFDGALGLDELLADARKNAVAIGPGCGVGDSTAAQVRTVLRTGRAVVLDADALTSFAGQNGVLFDLCHDQVVMTPHEGEFDRLFPGLRAASPHRLAAARAAAAQSGAVVVLKGPDTVIASPRGRAAILLSAPPTLATAGSGDVLTGLITGLLAQHMPAFEAAACGVWLHAACARHLGRGLIAEDLPEALPAVLADRSWLDGGSDTA